MNTFNFKEAYDYYLKEDPAFIGKIVESINFQQQLYDRFYLDANKENHAQLQVLLRQRL